MLSTPPHDAPCCQVNDLSFFTFLKRVEVFLPRLEKIFLNNYVRRGRRQVIDIPTIFTLELHTLLFSNLFFLGVPFGVYDSRTWDKLTLSWPRCSPIRIPPVIYLLLFFKPLIIIFIRIVSLFTGLHNDTVAFGSVLSDITLFGARPGVSSPPHPLPYAIKP